LGKSKKDKLEKSGIGIFKAADLNLMNKKSKK
jgi:hypothetical protein